MRPVVSSYSVFFVACCHVGWLVERTQETRDKGQDGNAGVLVREKAFRPLLQHDLGVPTSDEGLGKLRVVHRSAGCRELAHRLTLGPAGCRELPAHSSQPHPSTFQFTTLTHILYY